METGWVIIPIVTDGWGKLSNMNCYVCADLQSLKSRILGKSGILSLPPETFLNLKGDEVVPYDFRGKEWTIKLGSDCEAHIVCDENGLIFNELFGRGKMLFSGFTGSIIVDENYYIETSNDITFCICKNNELISAFSIRDKDAVYGSSLIPKRLGSEFKADMKCVPYYSEDFQKTVRRKLVANPKDSLAYSVSLRGLDYPLERLMNDACQMGIHLSADNLLEYSILSGAEWKDLGCKCNLNSLDMFAREQRGYKILSEDTILYMDWDCDNDAVSVLWHNGYVFIGYCLFVWDKYFHGNNCVYTLSPVSFVKNTSRRIHYVNVWTASLDTRCVSSCYMYDVSKEDFIWMTQYFPCIIKSRKAFKGLNFAEIIKYITGRAFKYKEYKNDSTKGYRYSEDKLRQLSFPKLPGQEEADDFVTRDYYYTHGGCIKLDNYNQSRLERMYRDEGKHPNINTILKCVSNWLA